MADSENDLVEHLAEFTVGVTYESLPEAARTRAKQSIMDTLGVAVAASGIQPDIEPILGYLEDAGGRQESTVIGSATKAPAALAAFANGAMAHSLDYDDYTRWGHHAASTVVPAVFALAERLGGVTGKDMVTAVAIGQDIFARLRCNVEWRKDWNMSPVMGVFAAAAAGSKLFGFEHEQVAHALGIASMSSAGTMEVVQGVSDLRGIYAAFSAEGSVQAVLLAERGVTGIGGLFEGSYGFFNSYFAGKFDKSKILEGLGQQFPGSETLYKRWPSVSTSHSHIHATIGLVQEHGLTPDDVAEIRVHVGDWHQVMCTPLEKRRAPETVLDAKFSLPFLVAIAAVRGEIRVADLNEPALADADVLALARRVVPVTDPNLNWNLDIPAGKVEIATTDGRHFERRGSNVPGSAEAPMTWADLGDKFDDCAAAARRPISHDRIDSAKKFAEQLEAAPDATELLRLLN